LRKLITDHGPSINGVYLGRNPPHFLKAICRPLKFPLPSTSMTSDSESKDCSLELVQDPAVPDSEAAFSPEPRELSVEDLVSARDILLGFFPPELVYIILDLAEYWARTTSIRDDTQAQVKVTTSGSRGKGATLCYLTTPPILGDQGEEVHLRVMRVECVIVSHDPTPGRNYPDDPCARLISTE
jgi:hypothetical protein